MSLWDGVSSLDFCASYVHDDPVARALETVCRANHFTGIGYAPCEMNQLSEGDRYTGDTYSPLSLMR